MVSASPAASWTSTSTSVFQRDPNAEVAKGSKRAAADIWMAYYLLYGLYEKHEMDVEIHCKPIKGDWNGSGMYANVPTTL